MNCPVCHQTALVPQELAPALQVLHCPDCGGNWLSRSNMEAWYLTQPERQVDLASPTPAHAESDRGEAKLCPECHRIMLRYRVSAEIPFYVDHCPCCAGIWLDQDEGEQLRDRALLFELPRVFAASLQRTLRRQESAARLDELQRKRFGGERYARIQEMREWLSTQPHREALLACLSEPLRKCS